MSTTGDAVGFGATVGCCTVGTLVVGNGTPTVGNSVVGLMVVGESDVGSSVAVVVGASVGKNVGISVLSVGVYVSSTVGEYVVAPG